MAQCPQPGEGHPSTHRYGLFLVGCLEFELRRQLCALRHAAGVHRDRGVALAVEAAGNGKPGCWRIHRDRALQRTPARAVTDAKAALGLVARGDAPEAQGAGTQSQRRVGQARVEDVEEGLQSLILITAGLHDARRLVRQVGPE